jgi:hypothetical protein
VGTRSHGSKDRNSTIKFNPAADDGLIRTVIQVYRGVTGTMTPVMWAYVLRFIFSHPHFHASDPYPQLSPEVKRLAVEFPKAEFLALVLKQNLAHPS